MRKQPYVNWSYKAVLQASCSPSLSFIIFILKLVSYVQKHIKKKLQIQLFHIINTHGETNLHFKNCLNIFSQRPYSQTSYLKRYLSIYNLELNSMQTKSALTGSLQSKEQQWSCNSTSGSTKAAAERQKDVSARFTAGRWRGLSFQSSWEGCDEALGEKAQGQQSVGKAPGETRNLQYGGSSLKVHFRDIQKNKNRRQIKADCQTDLGV